MQNASWVTKQWSIKKWQQLIQVLEDKGIDMLLPSGNLEELDRAKEICSISNKAQAIDLMPLNEIAYIIKNADFCIISIEVAPRFDLWDQDWKVPLQYGFKQVFGENGGPGGLFHSLRVTPPIVEICDDINAICPNAFVFNYTNPMQRVCQTVTTKYPDMKFVGLCHEIASME